MAILLEELENVLRYWEDDCLYGRTMRELEKAGLVTLTEPLPIGDDGSVYHAPEFRRWLLESREAELPTRFLFAGSRKGEGGMATAARVDTIPRLLNNWTRSSRRVYSLSSDLQALLSVTSLDSVAWPDIPWPFGSFGIRLEDPIVDGQGRAYGLLMVETLPVQEDFGMDFRGVHPVATDSVPMFSDYDRRRIQGLLRERKWRKLASHIRLLHSRPRTRAGLGSVCPIIADAQGIVSTDVERTIQAHMRSRPGALVLDHDPTEADRAMIEQRRSELPEGTPLVIIIDKGGEDPSPEIERDWEFRNVCARIVAGTCLYLSALPPGSSCRSEWIGPPKPSSRDPHAISQGALVCSLESIHRLEAGERAMLKEHLAGNRPTHELSSHYRRGHWRRPPGSGDDPTAPRTIWVRPAWVRKDRLAFGEIPGGNLTQT